MLKTKPLQLRDGWPVASYEEAHLDSESMSGLTRWIKENHEYHNTHAVLIEHAGHLVYEVYLEGEDQRFYEPLGIRSFDVDSLHDLQSVSKSVTSLLLGIALGKDYARALATPVSEYFRDSDIVFGDGAEAVTLQHVLTMTAGFEWDVSTFPYSDPRNDNHQMFELVENPIAMILGRRVTDPPGSDWKYNNALTEVLAAIIEQVTGKSLVEFASEALFEPLGITSFEWLGMPQWLPPGRPSASGGLRMRARDLAKIGSLILHNGAWAGRQIVPQEWIRLSTRHHVDKVDWGMRGVYGYGFQWWPGYSNNIPPYQIIAGFGNGGQQLLIVPEHHLAVTVFAGNYGRPRQYMLNWMLVRIVAAHRSLTPTGSFRSVRKRHVAASRFSITVCVSDPLARVRDTALAASQPRKKRSK